MHSHLARNQRAVDHFLDEARLAARVSHPNVVQIQDLGKIGNNRRSARYGHSIYEKKFMLFRELLHHLDTDPTRRPSNHNAHDKTAVKWDLYGGRPDHQEAAAETRQAFAPCVKEHLEFHYPCGQRPQQSVHAYKKVRSPVLFCLNFVLGMPPSNLDARRCGSNSYSRCSSGSF
jgi:hypothetical protein